jgi:hypothetical protein
MRLALDLRAAAAAASIGKTRLRKEIVEGPSRSKKDWGRHCDSRWRDQALATEPADGDASTTRGVMAASGA